MTRSAPSSSPKIPIPLVAQPKEPLQLRHQQPCGRRFVPSLFVQLAQTPQQSSDLLIGRHNLCVLP